MLARHQRNLETEKAVANLLAFCIDQLGGSLVLDAVDAVKVTDGKWELEVTEQQDPYRVIYKVKEVK